MPWTCPEGCEIEHIERKEYVKAVHWRTYDIDDQHFNDVIDDNQDFDEVDSAEEPQCPECEKTLEWED